jgi:hypothetical protein
LIFPKINHLSRKLRDRLVAFRARTTGDSVTFSRIAVGVLIQVSSLGWESLAEPDESEKLEALEESGYEYDSHRALGARAVAFLKSGRKLGQVRENEASSSSSVPGRPSFYEGDPACIVCRDAEYRCDTCVIPSGVRKARKIEPGWYRSSGDVQRRKKNAR